MLSRCSFVNEPVLLVANWDKRKSGAPTQMPRVFQRKSLRSWGSPLPEFDALMAPPYFKSAERIVEDRTESFVSGRQIG
jgi:hypothetical protein